MKKLLILALCMFPFAASAEPAGKSGLLQIKQCIMQNSMPFCHSVMTQTSYPLFDKFANYRLLPCLPTDFRYESEQASGGETVVRASMTADASTNYYFKMVFVREHGKIKLDLPATMRTGLGKNWQNKVDMGEQIFLMMRQNMQDKLTCQVLQDLATPHRDN